MKKNYATAQEALDAFENLSNKDLLALRALAARYIRGTRYSEPADLIHEVLHRLLIGVRNWPKNVVFAAYVAQTMRSISNSERNCFENTKVLHFDAYGSLDSVDQELMSAHISYMNPEDAFQSAQASSFGVAKVSALKAAFANDPIAKTLINAWANNIQTKSILAQGRISQKDYDAARKRIARHIESNTPRSIQ